MGGVAVAGTLRERCKALIFLIIILIRDSVRNIQIIIKSSNVAVLRRWGGNKWTAYGEQERQGSGRALAG